MNISKIYSEILSKFFHFKQAEALYTVLFVSYKIKNKQLIQINNL